MWILNSPAVAADVRVDGRDLACWEEGFADLFARVAGRFAQAPSRWRAFCYLRGLLAAVERKNGWTIAEHAGDARPDGMQRLLNFYSWDADAVRDDLCAYVVEELGEPGAVLAVDETGFIKKGSKSAGVQRQYTGTTGKIDNCQLGVFTAYVSARGHALVDRELYLPASWTDDADRRAEAGISAGVGFATKPELARRMIARALVAGMPFSWVAGDEVYGANPTLRSWLQARRIGYVLAVACDQRVNTGSGPMRADALAAVIGAQGWARISAGNGSKGPRLYDWALAATTDPTRQLLIRRSITERPELAFYLCHTPDPAPLHELVRVAGARWAIEECFEQAKNETGLDHYQVRRYRPWYRHVTLSMLAHAWLAVTAAQHRYPRAQPGEPTLDTPAKKGTHRLWTTHSGAGAA